MATEQQRIPPERKPISEFPTPVHKVAFYTELVVRTDPAYKANAPVKRGTRYDTIIGADRNVIATYPDLFFLQEVKYGNDDQRVLWHWATDENAHDTYNADVTYVANAITYPAFTRVYTVRRELYEAEPTLPIGSPLLGIIAVEITSPGQNHTTATGVIDGTSVAIDFVVNSNGSLVSAVITNTGDELIQNGTPITIIGDGQDSSAIAVTQPVGCVLTAQKKEELPQDDPTQHELVRVTRVYETLPGPWIYSTRIDLDGMLVTTKTRRQVSDFITDEDELLGGEWIQTWHKETDDFVAEETVESRPVPGDNIVSTRVDEDGKVITIVKTLVDASTVVSGETLVGGIWTKVRKEEVNSTTFVKNDSPGSVLVCWQIVEARAIPGNPLVTTRVEEDGMVMTTTKILADASAIVSGEVVQGGFWVRTHAEEVSDLVAYQVQDVRIVPGNPILSTRVDDDGITVDITKTLKETSTIVTQETLVGNTWTKEHVEAVSDLVAWDVVEVREIPGNPIPDTELDKDGVEIEIARTMKAATAITTGETVFLGVWTRTESDPITDLVSWEVVKARAIPGNTIPSASIDGDEEVRHIATKLRVASVITPSSSEAGGFITNVEQREVSDLVSDEITTVTRWLDKAVYSVSIENLIPREFRAFIPTYVESHVMAGTASMPVLGAGEFEHTQRQITKNLYEDRITSLGSISLPQQHVNQELTEEYGGGILDVTLTLDTTGAMTIDEGYLVVRSTLTVLGNGMDIKETAQLASPATEWPILEGVEVDPRTGIVINVTKQVVDATTATGGVVGSEYIDLKTIDKWRSITIASQLDPSTLPDPVQWFTTDQFSFPNTLESIAWLWAAASDSCCYDFAMALETDITEGYSGPCKARITESFSNGPPPDDAPAITQFFPVSHSIGFAWAVTNTGEDCNLCNAFANTWGISPTLHPAITIPGGVILDNGNFTSTLPATVPTGLPASGTLITKSVDVERWRFGVFFRRITEIYVP